MIFHISHWRYRISDGVYRTSTSTFTQLLSFNQLLLKYRFTSKGTVGLLGTGAQDVHLDFHVASEALTTTTTNV